MIAKTIFHQEITRISSDIETIKRIDILNTKLREYNWNFFHPYNQVGEIHYFGKLLSENDKELVEEKIFDAFARKFLDFPQTITMIEGFYRKRPFLNDFILQIEESVVLCIQKDFSGAINLLIPVIEGSLRKYVVSKKGESKKSIIAISDLLSSFSHMTDDYLDLKRSYLNEEYGYLKESKQYLDANQERQILKLHRQYFELWTKQLRDYLINHLYKNTKGTETISDSLNRHSLVHGFQEVEYTFRNYLRLFNCLNYLSWAIGLTRDDCSVLAEVDDGLVESKWVDYLKLLIISELSTEIKSSIYKTEIRSFEKYLEKEILKVVYLSKKRHEQLFSVYDSLKKMLASIQENTLTNNSQLKRHKIQSIARPKSWKIFTRKK